MTTPSAENSTDLELRLTRVFDAPRPLVFEAWTNPEHIKRWLAPRGFTVTEASGELRPGGPWRSVMRAPDGEELPVGGVYREIVPGERLVFTHAWEGDDGLPEHETVVTLLFADADGGKTRLDFHQAFFASKDSRDRHNGGWSECLDILAEYLRSKP